MSSLVMSHVIHISTMSHIVNQCNLVWKSKRPTCYMKGHVNSKVHGSQIVMRVFEQPQDSISPVAINTPSFVHVKNCFTFARPRYP